MDHLTSPKLTPGVHCLNLRHKGMYVMSVPYADESTFYDKYDQTAYWCALTQTGFGPDREPAHDHVVGAQRRHLLDDGVDALELGRQRLEIRELGLLPGRELDGHDPRRSETS